MLNLADKKRQEKKVQEHTSAVHFLGRRGRGNKDETNARKVRALLRIRRSLLFVSIVPCIVRSRLIRVRSSFQRCRPLTKKTRPWPRFVLCTRDLVHPKDKSYP
jgi:hypothetical protein